ncbi:MAG: FCD domain-containing protein [Anaerolineales bacterium]
MSSQLKFDLLDFLSCQSQNNNIDDCEIPSLKELSHTQGVSIAKLREQLSVARSYGFVDVQPKTGIKLLPYSFAPAVKKSLSFALSLDRSYFDDFSQLRRHIEANYWFEAVKKLDEEDIHYLQELVDLAWAKLESSPPRLPHQEHRDLHLTIYGKIENVFVRGLLEAYWDAYEEVGLNRYTELAHLKDVWDYHRKIVEALFNGEIEEGFKLLLEHMDLLKGVVHS